MKLEWWPITRDSILYSINLLVLVWFSWDSKITLFESIILVVMYFAYFVILFQNKRILNLVTGLFAKKRNSLTGECVSIFSIVLLKFDPL